MVKLEFTNVLYIPSLLIILSTHTDVATKQSQLLVRYHHLFCTLSYAYASAEGNAKLAPAIDIQQLARQCWW
jgi:hypothetical protein